MMRETPPAGVQLQLASARAALLLADEYLTHTLHDLGGEACCLEPCEISGFRSMTRLFVKLLGKRLRGVRPSPFAEALGASVAGIEGCPGVPADLARARQALRFAASGLSDAFWAMIDDAAGDPEDVEAVEAMADTLELVLEKMGRVGRRPTEPGLN